MMKNLINNETINKIKEVSIIILLLTLSVSFSILLWDIHNQFILDREYGKLIIQEKEIQLNTIEDQCGH